MPLQQLSEFLDCKTGLSDDGPQGAGFQVAAGMNWHCDGARWIGWMDEHVMTADDAIDNKSGPGQGADDPAAAHDRQASACHIMLPQ